MSYVLLQLKPELGVCRCGQPYCEEHYEKVSNANVYLIGDHVARGMPLYKLRAPCGNPECEKLFEGTCCGLYCYSKTTVIALRLLFDYLDDFLGGKTIRYFVDETTMKRYKEGPNKPGPDEPPDLIFIKEFMSRTTFSKIWARFASRLQLHGGAECCCPLCGLDPEVLICDGTSHNIPIERYSGEPITKACDTGQPCRVEHNKTTRRFCTSGLEDTQSEPCRPHDCMKLLRKFANWFHHLSTAAASRPGNTVEEFTEADARQLQTLTAIYRTRQLVAFLYERREDFNDEHKAAVGAMLLELSSISPVIAYLPHAVALKLRDVLRQQPGSRKLDQPTLLLLKQHSPIVYNFLDAIWGLPDKSVGEICGQLFGLMDELVQRTLLCGSGGSGMPDLPEPIPPSCLTSACMDSGICLGLPKVKDRQQYELDGNQDESICGCRHESSGGYRSQYKARKKKTGGIFTWFCRHGFCYGFYHA